MLIATVQMQVEQCLLRRTMLRQSNLQTSKSLDLTQWDR